MSGRITKNRLVGVMGQVRKPAHVTQQQFDCSNATLRKLAASDWDEIDTADLWEYFHDMAYVVLQPDLFAHLFPACLKYWYDTLMRDEDASRGDAEFHYSLVTGKIFDQMLSEPQRQRTFDIFTDGILDRLDQERDLEKKSASIMPAPWLCRFNSLGLVAPVIAPIWSRWWSMDSPGQAVSAIIYASGLIYLRGENPIFPKQEGVGPDMMEHDAMIYDRGWLAPNIDFLTEMLTPDYVLERLSIAAGVLAGQPEAPMATQILDDAGKNRDIMEIRIGDLLYGLARRESERGLWHY